MIALQRRNRQAEQMDQPDLPVELHRAALEGLKRLNRLGRSAALVWSAIEELCLSRQTAKAPLRVLDVACGGGDVAIGLARRAARRGMRIEVAGCDLSPYAVTHARQAAEQAGCADVEFFTLDAVAAPLPVDFDVVTCSLFLHHLPDAEIVELLGKMAGATRQVVVICDLERSRAGYVGVWLACHAVTRSPVVHVDGPLSIRAALTPAEIARLADEAGLDGARITRHWPFRWRLAWRPT